MDHHLGAIAFLNPDEGGRFGDVFWLENLAAARQHNGVLEWGE